ncbi:MAG: flagellar hook-basal body complex protein FliE [Gammaproteobacteria bacterium]|nr:flagellar hook-basal body complex protein FliE [Gammaproteobacteria bacterium]MDE2262169.1 flagellar hook-basal body complex protein FliE [Gammaproteobacteria bacterium]
MSQMEIDRVLAQIRSLSTQARPSAAQPAAAQGSGESQFATLLRQGIDQVNQSQQRATQLADAFARGAPGVELPQVMVQMEKASVSFRALTEVRNRLISAYQDIMNMQM